MHGHDTAHSAVFVHDYREIFAGNLHLIKQRICRRVFRDEHGGRNRVLHDVSPRLVVQAEIILGGKNACNIVDILAANGIIGVTGRLDSFFPYLVAFVQKQKVCILSMRAYFSDRLFLELKHVFDEFVFFAVYRALFTAGFRHHHNFFFRYFLAVLYRINSHQFQKAVRRNRKKPHDRREDNRYEP